jgi:hypothetical protein
MVPEDLIAILGDTHLYLNHLEQAKEQIGREYTSEELFTNNPGLEELKLSKNNFVKEQKWEEAAAAREKEKEFLLSAKTHTRQPFPLPSVRINTEFWTPGTDDGCTGMPGSYTPNMEYLFKGMEIDDFQLEDYQSHPAIKADLSN